MSIKGSIAFISHGGGPLPLLNDPAHNKMVESLRAIAKDIPKPDVIIVISAHWEATTFEIGSHANPELIYDYYGFPEEAYEIRYPANGAKEKAMEIGELLKGVAELNPDRGFDHGVFVPLKLMYPDANIPVIPISLKNNLNPKEHINLGKKLKSALNENVLILGSGFTFHNMKAFSNPEIDKNLNFENWLKQTLTTAMPTEERERSLINWATAPDARYAHPREEHLLPLHVCYGAANSPATRTYQFKLWGIQGSAYLWKSSNIKD